MSNADLIKMFFSMAVYYLPTMIVSLAAVIVIFIKWKQSPRAALWALLGFGLVLLMCIVVPVVNTAMQYWMFQTKDQAGIASRSWVFGVVGIFNALVHCLSYVFLLAAIFAGRSTQPRANSQPLDYIKDHDTIN
jgi:hypothetical protein